MNAIPLEFEPLRTLVRDLKVQWQMFDDLYSESKHYYLFQRTGPRFWMQLREYLLDVVFTSISRFFDPPRNRSQKNYSLAAVLEKPEVSSIRKDLQARLDLLTSKWEKGIKQWRHKKLSHSDTEIVLGREALPEIPYADISDLVSGIAAFVNEIDLRLYDFEVAERVEIAQWVPQVMRYLKAGVEKVDHDQK